MPGDEPDIQPGIYREASDNEISEEEANTEIDLLDLSPSPVKKPPTPVAHEATNDDTTPSVRVAVDKAAEILRELRGE